MVNIQKDILPIAREAGRIILAYRGNVIARKKTNGSPVTEADEKSNAYIVHALTAVDPAIAIIAEENPAESNNEALRAKKKWFVDSLDCTGNFCEGLDDFAVLIGYTENGEAQDGTIHFPATDETFFTQGNAAYGQKGDNDPVIIRANTTLLKDCFRLAVNWREETWPSTINGLSYSPVRGSGGETLCHVASGKADMAYLKAYNGGFYSCWDVAAYHALLRKAGADFIDMKTGMRITYNDASLSVPPGIGGHPDILKAAGYSVAVHSLA